MCEACDYNRRCALENAFSCIRNKAYCNYESGVPINLIRHYCPIVSQMPFLWVHILHKNVLT